MRAVILSDSHGEEYGLRWLLGEIWQTSGPVDAYIHLGDGTEDFRRLEAFLRAHDPQAQMYAVRGNCDFLQSGAPDEQVIRLGGGRVLLTHGHLFRAKQTYDWLESAAVDRGCGAVLFGHTHEPYIDMRRVLLLNPGSAANGRAAILDADGRGVFRPQLLGF